ncbi:DUF6111 family protein [uncultured Roseibium sp.]|uniref:DUF6111 family protein n=1 Tax=uncultured Roseibium sp. TaxID=1936171 RepID=UPI00262E6EAE|nr:DUF6111 family protein [uncultured Roseibium sp.]
MLRVFLTHLLLFLLPFFAYALWLWLSNKKDRPGNWSKGPIAWLTLTGLVLVVGGLVGMASYNQAPEGASWRPSEMRDGQFVPGRYE